MAAQICELKGSGDFTRGTTGTEGKFLCIVLGTTSQDDAEAAALAYFPPVVNGTPLTTAQATDLGGDVYQVELSYRTGTPTTAGPTAGNTPSNARPPGSGKNNTDKLTRDLSFTTGGGTRKKFYSINTRHALSAVPGNAAPDFGNLIGVTKDGKVDGCEVIAPACDFTISQRYASLDFGWFRTMLDTIATTNDADWLGMLRGEVLFKGCDGNYKDGDQFPWSVTAKFSYSRNMAEGDSAAVAAALNVGGIQIPDVYGHEYVWVKIGRAHV